MPTASSIPDKDIFLDELTETQTIPVSPDLPALLLNRERVRMAFSHMRDQAIFTDWRIIVAAQTRGGDMSYFSYPYARVQYFGIEAPELGAASSRLTFAFSDGTRLRLGLCSPVDMHKVSLLVEHHAM